MPRVQFFMALLVLGGAGGCGASRSADVPTRAPLIATPPREVASITGASPILSIPSPEAVAVDSDASPPPFAPVAPPDGGPDLDCVSISVGGLPGRRYLCDVAMGNAASALLDEKGYARITQFDSPGEDADETDGHLKARLCGKEAARQLHALFTTIRYRLADSEASVVRCHGLVCEVSGEGEWSHADSLYFRYGKKGLVLEAWTSLEYVLVEPAVVLEREKFIARGRKELANAPCSDAKGQSSPALDGQSGPAH